MVHTILVTDDSALDNAILRNYLYPEHFNLISALNGREALELLNARNIDLILLDMVMPVLDGFGFLEEFSKLPLYRKIPIIITTSLSDADSIKQIMTKYDIYDYVIKPLDHVNRLIMVNKIKTGIHYRTLLLEHDQTNQKPKEDGV